MPELPEVEVLKEILASRIDGREVAGATVRRAGLLTAESVDPSTLNGTRFNRIARFGRCLDFQMSNSLRIVVDLKDVGRFVVCGSETSVTKATAWVIRMSHGRDLRLVENGPEKTVRVALVSELCDTPLVEQAAWDPLSNGFTPAVLEQLCSTRRHQLRSLLTDQRLISGIGPIYADEILFEARLSPICYVNRLSSEERTVLYAAIRTVLTQATDTIRRAIGDGFFPDDIRDFLKLYKKAGKPCPLCGSSIREIRYAGERIRYCETCQRGTGRRTGTG